MKLMSLKNFRKKTKENPQGFMFKITCIKCRSDDVSLKIDGNAYGYSGGCESCGYGGGSTIESEILIKCRECSNAFHYSKEVDD